MSKRTVLNTSYKGLVESVAIPAELHERDGKTFASFGDVIPIHCCTPEQVGPKAGTKGYWNGGFMSLELVRTVLNTSYKGLVESMAIPAELHERDGKTFASFGDVIPIHCCTPEQIAERAVNTHHYCDLFTDEVLAPLGELAYVRLDENKAEKVFINRSKRLLLVSADGRLAQWRCAATFESANLFVAGTPIVNKDGALVSLVTAKRGNHYAVSAFEGEGGYFETSAPWQVVADPGAGLVYGSQVFPTRAALLQYISSLPPAEVSSDSPASPVVVGGRHARLALVAQNGRQLAHHYLPPVITDDVEYL